MQGSAGIAITARSADKLQVLGAPALQRTLRLRELEPMILELRETPMALLRRFVADKRLIDAVRLLAHSLPGREAVWWGCMCVRAALSEKPELSADPEFAMLRAAETWVRQSDPNLLRQQAVQASQACGGSPASWLGLAIEWNRRLVRPGAGFGQGVEAAVMRAAARRGPDVDSHLLRCLASGAEIAAGGAGRIPAEAVRSGP